MPGYVLHLEDARTFTKEGAWFKDADGRYLLFRGAGLGSRSKIAPYLPIYPLGPNILSPAAFLAELASKRQRLSALRELGFNVVRLVIQWKGLAPDQDTVAQKDYLDAVRTIVEKLFELGIYSLIDFHQDIAYEGYGGDGFPDWAVVNPSALPAFVEPSSGWSLRYFNVSIPTWPCVVPEMHAQVANTLEAFWELGSQNQARLVKTICATAGALKDLPGVLGYEPFNEPAQVGSLTKQKFEQSNLASFYKSVIDGIATVDPQAAVFIEPRVDWTYFGWGNDPKTLLDLMNFIKDPASEMKTFLPGVVPGEKTVFAFHYYDPETSLRAGFRKTQDLSSKPDLWSKAFAVMLKAAADRNLIPFLTEYGPDYKDAWLLPSTVNSRLYRSQAAAYMDLSMQQIEKSLVSSTLWAFDLYNTKAHNDNWNDEAASIMKTNGDIWDRDIIARPYPLRSSAKPSLLFFDSQHTLGVIIMEGKPTDKAPSVIFVPQNQYGENFEAHFTSGEVEWDSVNRYLYWTPDVSQTDHQIILCLTGGLDKNLLPEKSQALLPGTNQIYPSRSAPAIRRAMGIAEYELSGTWTNSVLSWTITFKSDDTLTERVNDTEITGTYKSDLGSGTVTIVVGGSSATYRWTFLDQSHTSLTLTDTLHGIESTFTKVH